MIRDHGYYGYVYVASKLLAMLSLLGIIGVLSNLMAVIGKSHNRPPPELISTLVSAILGFIWSVLSFTAYDDTHIAYYVTSGINLVFLVLFIVCSAVLGGPLSTTSCSDLSVNAKRAAPPRSTVSQQQISYVDFSSATQSTCYQLQTVWGLAMALSVLFFTSSVVAFLMFLEKRSNYKLRGGPGEYSSGDYPTRKFPMDGGAEPKLDYSQSPSLGGGYSGPYMGGGHEDYHEPAPGVYGSPDMVGHDDFSEPAHHGNSSLAMDHGYDGYGHHDEHGARGYHSPSVEHYEVPLTPQDAHMPHLRPAH